jgi:hypothetical protein
MKRIYGTGYYIYLVANAPAVDTVCMSPITLFYTRANRYRKANDLV